jgi:hypothetical protein
MEKRNEQEINEGQVIPPKIPRPDRSTNNDK